MSVLLDKIYFFLKKLLDTLPCAYYIISSTQELRVLTTEVKKMDMRFLNEREELVLRTIIDEYIDTSEPVGSRNVSKVGPLKMSPATIRNIMSDLVEKGFIAQPHTSAGRVPTDSGYRY